METVTLLPTSGKLKQKIRSHGDRWLVLLRGNDVACLPGTPAALVIPDDDGPRNESHPQLRWVPESSLLPNAEMSRASLNPNEKP